MTRAFFFSTIYRGELQTVMTTCLFAELLSNQFTYPSATSIPSFVD
jgi:hypothetical protein